MLYWHTQFFMKDCQTNNLKKIYCDHTIIYFNAFSLFSSYFGPTISRTSNVGWLFVFYGISTVVGYLIPNPILYKQLVLFQTIQFSVNTVSMSKTVPFQAIPFSISTQFKCKYTVSLSKNSDAVGVFHSSSPIGQNFWYNISHIMQWWNVRYIF